MTQTHLRSPKLTQIGHAYSALGSCFNETAVSASTVGLTLSPQASIPAELAVYERDNQSGDPSNERGFCSMKGIPLPLFYHACPSWGKDLGNIYYPLAQLIAAADAREREARAASMEDHFALRVAAAFPSLWQHPAIWASVATAHSSQWTFRLLGIEFCLSRQWGIRGGDYWEFAAWDSDGNLVESSTDRYYTPDADTALLAFVGAALRQARVIEGVAL